MFRCISILALVAILVPAASSEQKPPAGLTPAFYPVPELMAGFNLLYQQKFPEARQTFSDWQSHNPKEPLGEIALAASYLFEELYRQGVLTSDFFLNEKKF